MSYFSRVVVKPEALVALSQDVLAGDVYRDHVLIWKLFPDAPEAKRDFLFRSEMASHGPLVFYLVSDREPRSWHSSVRVESKAYQPVLEEGEFVHFSLRANPVISVAAGKGVRGKRHDVLMHAKWRAREAGLDPCEQEARVQEAALDWLEKRVKHWGLEVDLDAVQLDAYQQHVIASKGRNLQFSSVDYQGMGRVVDPVALTNALLGKTVEGRGAGMGRSLAFGCGLLMVKRML